MEAADIILWFNYLIDNLFVSFGNTVYQQATGIQMGTNCAVYLATLFTSEDEFLKRLVTADSVPVLVNSLSKVQRFVDDI